MNDGVSRLHLIDDNGKDEKQCCRACENIVSTNSEMADVQIFHNNISKTVTVHCFAFVLNMR